MSTSSIGEKSYSNIDKNVTFQWKEYMCFLTIVQLFNFLYITDWFEQLPFKNTVYFTFFFTFGYIVFVMPIIILYVFLGHYSKRKFLRVWEISPFFKGVGITALVVTILMTCYNVAITSYASLYVPLTFTMPWKNCDFKNAPDDCISSSDETILKYNYSNLVCCSHTIRYFCPLDTDLTNNYVPLNSVWYFRNEVMLSRFSHSADLSYNTINHKLVIISSVIWFLIGTFVILGLSKTKIVLYRFFVVSLIVISIIITIALVVKGNIKTPSRLTSDHIVTFENLGILTLKLSTRLVPSTYINIGALAPPTALPSIDVVCSGILTLLFMLAYYVFFVILNANMYVSFNLTNASCISSSGLEILIAVIPDVLNSISPVLPFFYYIVLVLMSLSYCTLTITCIVDALIDQNTKFQQYRWNLAAIVCIISAVITMTFFIPAAEFNYEIWFNRLDQIHYLLLVVFFLIPLFWVYGIDAVITDIEFKYKEIETFEFWKLCWKIIPFFAVILFIGNIKKEKSLYESIPGNLGFQKIFTMLSLIVVIPIPIAAVIHYFSELKNVTSAIRNVTTLTKHLDSWGPADSKEFKARQRFDPVREIGFKSEFYSCHHKCFKFSKSLEEEKQRIHYCIKMAQNKIGNINNSQ